MNIKIAFPVINFLMILLGFPIALGLSKGGTPLAITIGIGTCFLYLVAFGFSRSLGLSGMLPPIASAWLANVLFFFVGAYLMIQMDT
jgi:lipopolysaccharide export system permease protein